jgi:hypothetical protein
MSFYEIFVGELVELTTREQISGFYEDEENGPVQFQEPMVITGYLIDIDEGMYLLGQTEDEVREAVHAEQVWRIRIIDPSSLIKGTLEKFPVPDKPEEVN